MLGFLREWNRNLIRYLEPSGNPITKDAVNYKKGMQRMGGVRRRKDSNIKGVTSWKRNVIA